MVTDKATIEREAIAAAQGAEAPNAACRWPFTSPEGEHWMAVYLLHAGTSEATA